MRRSVPVPALLAEAIGTFALVFVGAGAIMVDAQTGALGHLGVALAFGLVIMAMIYAVGRLSGAHLNPAVSVAFALTRHFPWSRVATYVPAQVAGALVAALILRASLGGASRTSVRRCRPAGTRSRSCGSSCSPSSHVRSDHVRRHRRTSGG